MNKKTIFFALLFGVAVQFPLFAESDEEKEARILRNNMYKEYALEQGLVYKIYVKKDDGVTTVTFPSKIAKIAGMNVSLEPNADFMLSTKAGSYYFTVTALKEKATGTLNVTFNRNTYVLYLTHDPNQAYASVNFGRGGGASTSFKANVVHATPNVSAERLVSLIDMAKTYDLLLVNYPDSVANTSRMKFDNTYKYGDFNIKLEEVVRFEKDDTLVFRLVLENLSNREIEYDKHTFSAQTGENLNYMSVADASGTMPPRSKTYAFFAITSTTRGGRNNLSADNKWLIGLTTKEMHKQQEVQYDLPAEKPAKKEDVKPEGSAKTGNEDKSTVVATAKLTVEEALKHQGDTEKEMNAKAAAALMRDAEMLERMSKEKEN